jgi:hypothetical protein
MKVSDLAVDLNLVSGVAAGLSADSKVIDFGDAAHQVDIIVGPNKTQTLAMSGKLGVLVRASATVELSLGGFVELRGSVGFERRAQDVTLADGSIVKTQMLSVGGTGISGFVGLGPYGTDSNGNGKIDADEVNSKARGIGVRDVEFGLAMFTSQDAAYAGKRWTALTASVGAIDTLVGLPQDLKFQIRDLGVDVNQVSGYAAGVADSKVIDFSKRTVAETVQDRSVSLVTGTGKSLSLTHDGLRGNMLRASGGVTLDVAGFFMASGTMSIEKSSQTVTLANATQVNVDMLTIGGTGLDAFVGVNGPYRSDTNGDGAITLADATNPNAVGLTLSQAEFGLALLYEKGGSRNWISLEASALEVGLVGVPIVSATAQNLSVGINLVRGVAANSDANLQVIDYAGTRTDGSSKALSVYTGYGKTMALDMAGSKGELVQASGDFALSVADFVTVRGSLAFEKSRGAITLANGQTLVVDTLRVGGTGISAFAGVGGPYFVDSNNDGKIVVAGEGRDTPNPNAVGLVLSNAEFALALASVPSTANDLAGVTWLGLELQASQAAFGGVDAITMAVSNIQVEINQVMPGTGAGRGQLCGRLQGHGRSGQQVDALRGRYRPEHQPHLEAGRGQGALDPRQCRCANRSGRLLLRRRFAGL